MKLADKLVKYIGLDDKTEISLDLRRASSEVYKRVGLCYCVCGNISASFVRGANGGYKCMKCYQKEMNEV